MITDGTQGTSSGDGLAALMNMAQTDGATPEQIYYLAAQWYNQGSGSVAIGGDLGTYAQDVANRLTGWTN